MLCKPEPEIHHLPRRSCFVRRARPAQCLTYSGARLGLIHLPLDLPCPVVSGLGHGAGAGSEIGQVAKSCVRSRGRAQAVIPFALGVANR